MSILPAEMSKIFSCAAIARCERQRKVLFVVHLPHIVPRDLDHGLVVVFPRGCSNPFFFSFFRLLCDIPSVSCALVPGCFKVVR